MSARPSTPHIAIACGGTGGHLFPGMAVAEELFARGARVTVLVSPKQVDQQALRGVEFCDAVTLPAVALQGCNLAGFLRGFGRACREARRAFVQRSPQAVLAMGGFTSAPAILAAKSIGAATFLHEANTVPGRSVRWLAPWVDEVFVGFPSAAGRLRNRRVVVTGTPVRPQCQPADPAACRMSLGLDEQRPVLLVMGGSQGARALNEAVQQVLGELAARVPDLQFVHLTGPHDLAGVRAAYAERRLRAVVQPFLTEMELALGAATVALSRAGASSLAEFAALRLPAVLVPYPSAADNHQFHNARALVESGAARLWEQSQPTDLLLEQLVNLLSDAAARAGMQNALARWHHAGAAEQIATAVLSRLERAARTTSGDAAPLRGSERASSPPFSNRSRLWQALPRGSRVAPSREPAVFPGPPRCS